MITLFAKVLDLIESWRSNRRKFRVEIRERLDMKCDARIGNHVVRLAK